MYEMLYMDIPVGASINEGVELAKKYDSDEAAAFINGVLGAFVAKELAR
jgi:N utilization substance protein B